MHRGGGLTSSVYVRVDCLSWLAKHQARHEWCGEESSRQNLEELLCCPGSNQNTILQGQERSHTGE